MCPSFQSHPGPRAWTIASVQGADTEFIVMARTWVKLLYARLVVAAFGLSHQLLPLIFPRDGMHLNTVTRGWVSCLQAQKSNHPELDLLSVSAW